MGMECRPSELGQGAAGLDRKAGTPPMDRLAEQRRYEHCKTQKVAHRQKPGRTRIRAKNTINAALEEQSRRQGDTQDGDAEPGKIQQDRGNQRNREPESDDGAKMT